MRMRNLLLLNDWEIGKALQAVVLLQAAVLISLYMAHLGLGILIVQVPISFVYLTFVPGILILRILKLHELGNVRTLLYSTGLSLSFLMAVGFFMNAVFPKIGLTHPVSFIDLAAVLTSLVLILCVLSYVRDKEFSNPAYVQVSFGALSPQLLLLALLPFATILATVLMNSYGTNALQMVLLLIIMAIPFFVVLDRIPPKNYACVLFVISFSLLFHTALISSFVWGTDVIKEIVLARSVLQSGAWNLSLASNYAGMLSVVMLPPIYSIFSNVSVDLVLKVLYPFIYSFVPLGLFVTYKGQTGDKVAFLSSFFFMTFAAFFVTMPTEGREEIAQLFLILIVLLVVDDRVRMGERSLLLLVFAAALVVSHYGTSYFFLLILAVALPVIYIALPRVARAFKARSRRGTQDITILALFFAAFVLAWYLYVSPRAQPIVSAISLGSQIVSNFNELFNPAYNQPAAYLTNQLVTLQTIERAIILLSFVLILVGLVAVFVARQETSFTDEFVGFACGSCVFLLVATTLPLVAQALQSDRIINLTFIFLAPFCIIGLMRSLRLLGSSVGHAATRLGRYRSRTFGSHKKAIFVAVSVFLAIWVAFNSAFVYQLFDQPKVGRFALDNSVDFLRLNEQERSSGAWLSAYQQKSYVVYADSNKASLLRGLVGDADAVREISYYQPASTGFHHSYVFLGSYNLEHTEMLVVESRSSTRYVTNPEIPQASTIFDDGGSRVLVVN